MRLSFVDGFVDVFEVIVGVVPCFLLAFWCCNDGLRSSSTSVQHRQQHPVLLFNVHRSRMTMVLWKGSSCSGLCS